MSSENNAEQPKNPLGEALPEAFGKIREELKEDIIEKIKTDIDNLSLAEREPVFGNSQEIFQIKEELNFLLGKASALENPTEADITSLETEREALSNRLSESIQRIEREEDETKKGPVPVNLPVENEGVAHGEKLGERFEISEEAKGLIGEMEQIKNQLDKISVEDFDIPSELAEQLNDRQRRLGGLIEFLAKDNSQPLLDKSREEIGLAQKVIEKYEAQSTSETKMEDPEKPADVVKPSPPVLAKPIEPMLRAQDQKLKELIRDVTEHKPPQGSEVAESANEKEVADASKSAEQDIPKEVLDAVNKIETTEDVEQLPEETKEKISVGLWDFGFRIKEGVNGFIGGKIKGLAERRHAESVNKKEADGAVTRLLFATAEKYNADAKDAAQKRAEAAAGGSKRLIGQSVYVGGRVLRYGRLFADIARETGLVKWVITTPFSAYTRWATALGMLAESGFDIAKEAQLRQEKFLEQDSEKAAKAAWEIYRELETKKGGATPTRAELDMAYKEKLPKDILERLDKGKESGIATQTMQKLFGIWIEKSMQRMQENIVRIENNSSIKVEDKERERQKIYNDYSVRLRDFDRALNETGTVDTAAMTFKLLSSTAKWVVRAVAVESIYMGGEKIVGKIAEILGRQTEADTAIIFERLEAHLGINSQDGIDEQEALKIGKIIKEEQEFGYLEKAEQIKNHYPQISDYLEKYITGQTVPHLETAPLGGTISQKIQESAGHLGETIKPFRFENVIAGSGDSVWFSTEQSFRINPDHFGYNAAKDGDLNEWARKKTAEVIKELADKKYGGKIPDLVHDGDKVIVEIGADGRPHIELEASSGMPLGHLPEKPLAAPETVATPETKVGIEKFKDAWEKTPVDSRDSIVRQYVLGEMGKPEYTGHNFPVLNQEKVDAYVQTFAGGDWDKIKTPEGLAESLQNFDVNLKAYTRQLLEGKFDRNLSPQAFQELKRHPFPIESTNGKIFFTQFVDEGRWQLFEVDKQGLTHQLEHKKGWFGGQTQIFDTMHIRKFLRGH